MSAVIVNNSSINNSFISTIDHLPCDVIRSLWLVQSINIAIDKNKNELQQILLHLQNTPEDTDKFVERIIHCKSVITRLGQEAIQETSALNNQLITHNIGLNDELQQLRQLAEAKLHKQNVLADKHHLRKQLMDHYKKNPLRSQVEALKKQKLSKLTMAQPSKPSGLKLVLKLSKPSKLKLKSKPIKKAKIKPSRAIVLQPVLEEKPAQIEEDTNVYCFCKQGSFGDMIACDNEQSCPNGEWFHYKCVGLLNRVEALKYTTGKEKWFCSDACRQMVEAQQTRTTKKKKTKKRRW